MKNQERVQAVITKYKKNSSFPASSEKIYTEALEEILFASGFNSEAEMLIFSGPPDKGIRIFWTIVSKTDITTQRTIINDFFNSDRYHSNVSGSATNRTMALLYEMINSGICELELIQMVYQRLMTIVRINSRTTDAFLTLILKRIDKQGFELLIYIFQETGSNKAFVDLCNKACKSSKGKTISYGIKNLIATKLNMHLTTPNGKSRDNGKEDLGQQQQHQHSKSLQLREIADYIDNLEKEIANLHIAIEKLQKNEIEFGEKTKKMEARISFLSRQNEDLGNQKNSLDTEISILKSQVTEQEKIIVKLTEETEKHIKVMSIYNAERERSQQEFLNAIASKLKVEYIDFLDAIDMEMNIALGDNMREQLKAVFRILEKNGIVPGSR